MYLADAMASSHQLMLWEWEEMLFMHVWEPPFEVSKTVNKTKKIELKVGFNTRKSNPSLSNTSKGKGLVRVLLT
jgi:hypothetical protein